MRDYGRIYSRFWISDDIHALSDDGKLLALYLLSGPHGTIAGVCRLTDGYVSDDLKWSVERVSKGFAELFEKGFANRCGTTKWVWIRKFLTWNQPENPNQWKAARKIVQQVPINCSWRAEFIRDFAIAAGDPIPEIANPSGTVLKPLPTQEQHQDQEQHQEQQQQQEGLRNPPQERAAAVVNGTPKPEGIMATALRDAGVTVTSHDPTLLAWLRDGFTTEQAVEAVGIARIRKPWPEAIPAKYLDPILRTPPKSAEAKKPRRVFKTVEELEAIDREREAANAAH